MLLRLGGQRHGERSGQTFRWGEEDGDVTGTKYITKLGGRVDAQKFKVLSASNVIGCPLTPKQEYVFVI